MRTIKKFYISHDTLQKLLRLPKDVEVAAVKADPTDSLLVVTVVDPNNEMPPFIEYGPADQPKDNTFYGVTALVQGQPEDPSPPPT